MPEAKDTQANSTDKASASLICGVIGVLFAVLPPMFIATMIFGALATLMGMNARNSSSHRKMAVVGRILGVVSLILGTVWMGLYFLG